MAALLTKTDNPYTYALSSAIEDIELPRWRGQSRPSLSLRTSSLFDDAQTEASSLRSASATLTPATTAESACFEAVSLRDLKPIRILIFSRSVLWSDPTISLASELPDAQDTPLYHASTHELNVWLPDVILYRSTPTVPKASIMAAAHFRFSRNARLGFGNDLEKLNGKDTHDGDVAWESLKNTSTFLRHYQYDFSVPPTYEPRSVSHSEHQYSQVYAHSGTPTYEVAVDNRMAGTPHIQAARRNFRLYRTHAAIDGVDGWLGWASFRNYKIVDLMTGEVVGIFLSSDLRSLTEMGELRLYEDVSEEVQRGIVLAVVVVCEKHIRRCRKRRAGGDGGGEW